MAGQANGQTGNGGNNNKIVIILLGVIVVLLIIATTAFAMLYMKSSKTNQTETNETAVEEKRSVVVNENNADEVAEEILSQEPNVNIPKSYDAVMNSDWHFADGKSASDNAYVENAKENTTDIYFDVLMADTEEVIYQSPVIPLGEHIEKFKLDKELSAGTYDCVVVYHLIDEDQNTLTTVNMAITVTIEN